MNDKIKELLAVLDLSRQKQESWIRNYFAANFYPLYSTSLAALAFRLRDEMKLLEHYPQFQGRLETYNYMRRNIPNRCDILHIDEHWWAMEAQPIHWIIAALIAKELACEQS